MLFRLLINLFHAAPRRVSETRDALPQAPAKPDQVVERSEPFLSARPGTAASERKRQQHKETDRLVLDGKQLHAHGSGNTHCAPLQSAAVSQAISVLVADIPVSLAGNDATNVASALEGSLVSCHEGTAECSGPAEPGWRSLDHAGIVEHAGETTAFLAEGQESQPPLAEQDHDGENELELSQLTPWTNGQERPLSPEVFAENTEEDNMSLSAEEGSPQGLGRLQRDSATTRRDKVGSNPSQLPRGSPLGFIRASATLPGSCARLGQPEPAEATTGERTELPAGRKLEAWIADPRIVEGYKQAGMKSLHRWQEECLSRR